MQVKLAEPKTARQKTDDPEHGEKERRKMYDYRNEMKADIINAISEQLSFDKSIAELSREDLAEKLNDELWTWDSVTGNGSGSYWFSTWKAEEALSHNWDLMIEALGAFGCGPEYFRNGPEALDVTIRCYLLGEMIESVLDLIEETAEDFAEAVAALAA